MNGPPLIKVRNLHKHFGANHVLRGIDFEVATGEVLVIIGPSGSGKSTLLRCINFLEDYDEGEIWFGDALVGYRRDGTGRLVRDREASERDRYRRYYGIDLESETAGLRVDSSDQPPASVAQAILDFVRTREAAASR